MRSVGFERQFDAFDDDSATVVATHDIHCDSHKVEERGKLPAPGRTSNYAPAVTVRTWRPL